jgi:segregation and condensation protein B
MNLNGIVEAIILAASKPVTVDYLVNLLGADFPDVGSETVRAVITDIGQAYQERALELSEVAGGYRFQVRQAYAEWVGKMTEERPQRYGRALLETLAIIAYRQPITRADIEDIRGVAVSTQIVKTLQEREWIRVVGYKEVPGRPALLATTRQFLDYFNLHSLDQLPPLSELRDFDEVSRSLDLKLAVDKTKNTPAQDADENASAESAVPAILH